MEGKPAGFFGGMEARQSRYRGFRCRGPFNSAGLAEEDSECAGGGEGWCGRWLQRFDQVGNWAAGGQRRSEQLWSSRRGWWGMEMGRE